MFALAKTMVQQIGADLVSIIVFVLNETLQSEASSSIFTLIDCLVDLEHVSLVSTEKSSLLIRLLQQLIRGEYGSRLIRVGCKLIKGLTRHPDSKAYIVRQPGLVDDIISVLFESTLSEEVKPEIAEILKNLAWDWSIKLELIRKKNFLTGLANLFDIKWNDNMLRMKTRISAIEIISRLGTEAMCKKKICYYKKGMFLRLLIVDTVSSDARSFAAQAILRLLNNETAPFIIKKYPDLLKNLASTTNLANAVYNKNQKQNNVYNYDQSPSVRSFFSREDQYHYHTVQPRDINVALVAARLARYITVRDTAHPLLLTTLTKLAYSIDQRKRVWAAKGLREQSRTSTGRFFMVRTPQVLDSLVTLANDACRMVQSPATEALLWFASDSVNVKRLVYKTDVLETFVNNGNNAEKCTLTCRSSIQAIISLASHDSSQERVAKTIGLVEVLSKYGISDDEDSDLKTASLRCVIMLAPLM